MFTDNEFKIYYVLLKVAGLLNDKYDVINDSYNIQHQIMFYSYQLIIQILLIICIAFTLVFKRKYFFENFNKTGNYYLYFAMQLTSELHIILNIWWILKQYKHLEILETIRKWSYKYLDSDAKTYPFYTNIRLKVFYIFCIIYLVDMLQLMRTASPEVKGFLHLPFIMYAFRCIITMLISALYIRIVRTISMCFKYIALQMEQISLRIFVRSLNKFELQKCCKILKFYNKIVIISSEDVSKVYGIPMFICTIFISLEAISNFYILAIFDIANHQFSVWQSFVMILQTVSWMIPMMFMYIAALCFNNLREEVSFNLYLKINFE